MKLRMSILIAITMASLLTCFGEQPGIQPTPTIQKSCLVVRPIGSHAVRNTLIFGLAGAVISKQQYQVVDAVNYPAKIKQKFHGSDLQAISSSTRIVILDKKDMSLEDAHKGCQVQ
jgi:hypothetical protein